MNAALRGPVCDLLGCSLPLAAVGEGGIGDPEFVSAVSRAGGFGFLVAHQAPSRLARDAERAGAATGGRFGVDLSPVADDPAVLDAWVSAMVALGLPVACLRWSGSDRALRRLRGAGIVTVCEVRSRADAVAAERAGAGVLVAAAPGPGRELQRLDLLPEIAGAVPVPVLAAGGSGEGAALVLALALGAQGVVLGALSNPEERLRTIADEARGLLQIAVPAIAEAGVPSSPPCAAHEAEDRYMGYAGRDELVAALNALIEAERACLRTLRRAAVEAGDPSPGAALTDILLDRARWCGILVGAVRDLGGAASTATGAGHARALATADPEHRLAMLARDMHRSSGRAACLLPQVRDNRLHDCLAAYRAAQERDIRRIEACLSGCGTPA